MKVSSATEYIRTLLQQGRYTFTKIEADAVLGGARCAQEALLRQQQRGWVFSPSRGLYVIIDPPHQLLGALPIEWFIEEWASFLGFRYYIGGLTAAQIHGAAHQKPQHIYVIADHRIPEYRHNTLHVIFLYKKLILPEAWEQRVSPAGYYRVSTPEMTAYDLLRYPTACPSLDLAATVYAELGEHITPETLATLVTSGGETAVLQRVGWLLDATGWGKLTAPLAQALASRRRTWRPLRTDRPTVGYPRDERWRLIINASLELDES